MGLLLTRQGHNNEARTEFEQALTAFTAIIERNPTRASAWSGRAGVHFDWSHWEESISDYSKAIELSPDHHGSLWHRGHAYLNLAKWDRGATEFAHIVERWPDSGEGYYRLATAHAQLHKLDAALADLRVAISKGFVPDWMKNDSRLEPVRSRPEFRELVELARQVQRASTPPNGDRIATIADSTKLLGSEPNNLAALRNRAEAHIQLGLLPEAIADDQRAYELAEPASSLAFLQHALLRLCADDESGYHEACQRMLARYANAIYPDSKLHLAIAHSFSPRTQIDPIQALRFTERSAGDGKAAWDVAYLGLTLYRAGQDERAIAALKESFTLNDEYNPPFLHAALSMAHHRLGNTEQATLAFSRAGSARDDQIEQMLSRGIVTWNRPWWDVIHGELLFREACLLRTGSPPSEDLRLVILRARVLNQTGRSDDALTLLLTLSRRDPHNSRCVEEIRNFVTDRIAIEQRPLRLERCDRELADSPFAPDWYAMRGHWQPALSGMLTRIKGHSDDFYSWYLTASLYAQLNDAVAYRRHCREMLKRFGENADAPTCERIAKGCLLLPAEDAEVRLPRELANRALTLAPEHASIAYFELAQALADYRARDYAHVCEVAGNRLRQNTGMGSYGFAILSLLEAMSYFQQGNVDQARRSFDIAIQKCDALPQISKGQLLHWDWQDGIAVLLIRREAEQLFNNSEANSNAN